MRKQKRGNPDADGRMGRSVGAGFIICRQFADAARNRAWRRVVASQGNLYEAAGCVEKTQPAES